MELKAIRCTVCGAPIGENNIDLKAGKAVCSHCGTVFRTESFTIPREAEVAMPKGFSTYRDEGGLYIKRKWYSPQVLFFFFFAIFWDGALALWFALTLSGEFGIFALFGVLHGSIGLGITYYVICGFVNTSTFSVGRKEISLLHRPLPWPGAFRCSPGEIDFIEYADRARSVARTFSSAGTEDIRIGTGVYMLRAFFRDGSRRIIFTGIPSERHAAYVQRLIEEEIGRK